MGKRYVNARDFLNRQICATSDTSPTDVDQGTLNMSVDLTFGCPEMA